MDVVPLLPRCCPAANRLVARCRNRAATGTAYNRRMAGIVRHLAVIVFVTSSVLTVSHPPAVASDFCGPRTIGIADASWWEGGLTNPGTLNFTVLTTGCAAGSVRFETVAGSAAPGADYVATTGELSWPVDDSTERTISVPLVGDNIVEPDEGFTVVLSQPTGLAVTDGTGFGEIRDDDPFEIYIGFADPSGSRPFCLEICVSCWLVVESSAPAATDVVVQLATRDGTARAGADYTAATTRVVIPAGGSRAQFGIAILDDTVVEKDEYFYVTVTDSSAGRFGSHTLTVTLVDA